MQKENPKQKVKSKRITKHIQPGDKVFILRQKVELLYCGEVKKNE